MPKIVDILQMVLSPHRFPTSFSASANWTRYTCSTTSKWTSGYGFPLSKLKGFRVISEALSFIIDPTCTLPSFQFSNDTDALGIDHVRQEIVNAVLKNNSLLSIQLDIRHNDTNILTAEDEATIQQHIENHRKTIRNEIESIGWHSNMEEDKMEYMPSGVSDLIYQYIIPQWRVKKPWCCFISVRCYMIRPDFI